MNLKVLGSGQDGGIPHTGCCCSTCSRARKHKRFRRLGPSVAVFDRKAAFCCLIDASPDLKAQIDMVREGVISVKRKGKIPVSAIMLTHAHFGHIAGLLQLGKEVLNEDRVPVFCTPRMKKFLSSSLPFKHLVRDKNIVIREARRGVKVAIGGLRFTPIRVPHRGEITDTVGYIIEATKRVIYVPDVDRWTDRILSEIRRSDLALIDGTFYSRTEVSNYIDVPHPPIKETARLLDEVSTETYFTHINHTNPVNRRGPARTAVTNRGFKIAYDCLTLPF